jgi:5'(3')-deoxyribonucleotidase
VYDASDQVLPAIGWDLLWREIRSLSSTLSAIDAVGTSVDAGELLLESARPFGDEIADDRLGLGPVASAQSVEPAVVRLLEDDHRVAVLAQLLDVVRRVVDVGVRFDLGFGTEEADVAVGNAVDVEPGGRVADRLVVAPVHVQAMGDDAYPDARVGEPPQGVGGPGNHVHRAEHVVLHDGDPVKIGILAGGQTPLAEVPRPFERVHLGVDAADVGEDLAEPPCVVGDDTIEIDAQHELPVHASQPARVSPMRDAPRPPRPARSRSRLGIDLDGVVADFNAGWIMLYNDDFGTSLGVDDVDGWNAPVRLTHFQSMSEFWRWSATAGHGASIFRVLRPYPDAVETLQRLGRRHHVVIVTTKPDFAIHDTYAWLAEHQVPTTEVHIVDDKTTVSCDVYLEDADHNLEDLRDSHPAALVCRFVRPWNHAHLGVSDVGGWSDFEALVDGRCG